MKVLKFGGTSVGSAKRIQDVAALIRNRGKNIIVLSAMSGTTNTLIEISNCLRSGNEDEARHILNVLRHKYADTVEQLYKTDIYKQKAAVAIAECLDYIESFCDNPGKENREKNILAQGEMMSTAMMNLYLQEQGVNSKMLPALEFMRTDINGEPDSEYIKTHINKLLDRQQDADIYITQGFVCLNATGSVDNLQRGGSDYTASLIGAAINAEEVEIWTDIDGMHNNDPRYVEGTEPVETLHFDEAAELAYFGAKILHPTCILPAKMNNIPVRLLNTMQPQANGTLIYNSAPSRTIKAIAAKDNITAIKIKSGRMLLAYGFLRKVFEIFETYRTPIDMITTSEVGVSMTIDNESHLTDIIKELEQFGSVTIDRDMVIICVVGDMEWQNRGFEAQALDALSEVPVRMISYGGSNYNISFLVRKEDKIRALNLLSDVLFKNKKA